MEKEGGHFLENTNALMHRILTYHSSFFLDASSHLYKRPCPSVGWSLRPSVRHAFVKIDEKWPFMDSK